MQKDTKLQTASLLMALSICLLVLLQGYWLRNAWLDEYRRLKRELSVILRETIFKEEMKQLVHAGPGFNLETFASDSLPGSPGVFRITGGIRKDSAAGRQKVSIVVSSADSGHFPMPPRLFSFDQDKHFDEIDNPKRLAIEFPMPMRGSDLDTIEKNFAGALAEAGINLPFVLRKIPMDTSRQFSRRGEIRLRSYKGDKQDQYKIINPELVQASFGNPFLLLLQKIQLQLIFALVMIIVTTIAFVFLYRNLRQQQRLSELKNDFIANVTHELKTPIATVGVAIEALKNFDAIHDAGKTREYLDISGNELQRLNLLVDKVLRLSMHGQQQLALQKESVDMKQLLQEVINSLKLQFEKQGAQVSFETEGSDLIVAGDRMHLVSVFYNLLDNALKYSPEQPIISIVLKAGKNAVTVKITDNGLGISSFHLNKIFDKFYRVPHGNTHDIKGYGLGLSYVNEVIKAHGGTIEVESNEGQGSTFIVNLVK